MMNTQTSITEVGLSERTVRVLSTEGIEYIEELANTKDWELRKIPNLGNKALEEIQRALGRPPQVTSAKKSTVQSQLDYERKRCEVLQAHCRYLESVLIKHGLESELLLKVATPK